MMLSYRFDKYVKLCSSRIQQIFHHSQVLTCPEIQIQSTKIIMVPSKCDIIFGALSKFKLAIAILDTCLFSYYYKIFLFASLFVSVLYMDTGDSCILNLHAHCCIADNGKYIRKKYNNSFLSVLLQPVTQTRGLKIIMKKIIFKKYLYLCDLWVTI